ncbi:MAG TPA: SRPBCC domain-containing protein [Oculatellaceae cyanobacterium]
MVTYYICTMDDVFRALADPTRRELLDELFKSDGQTLAALEKKLPMTRFGVMKHLKVLEEAGLVVTKRRGREKLHFLNPVRIRLVHDRWVSKYAEPWAAALSDLKQDLEEQSQRMMEKVFEIYIKTTPERLWEAITSTELRAKYNFGLMVSSDFTAGSSFHGVVPQTASGEPCTSGSGGASVAGAGSSEMPKPIAAGTKILEGENLEVVRPYKLVQSFRALWGEDVKQEGTSRVTWEIEQIGDSCRLTVTHDQLREGANAQLYGGWPMILSGLKTLLETGELLTTPGSLRFASR